MRSKEIRRQRLSEQWEEFDRIVVSKMARQGLDAHAHQILKDILKKAFMSGAVAVFGQLVRMVDNPTVDDMHHFMNTTKADLEAFKVELQQEKSESEDW